MIKYVINPNLPEKAEYVLIGEKYKTALGASLSDLGLIPLYVPDNPSVDARISGHVDLSVCHAGRDKIILAPYLAEWINKIKKIFPTIDAEILNMHQNSIYPHDCQLNICAFGNSIVCSKNTVSEEILDNFPESYFKRIYVKQGYCKCSTCVVDGKSVITSDKGISKALSSEGIDVLEITPGHICLDGYEYGFIGGSAFKIAKSTIAFTGKLDLHPDKNKIIDFIEARNIHPVYLTDKEIFDIGGIVPLTENSTC